MNRRSFAGWSVLALIGGGAMVVMSTTIGDRVTAQSRPPTLVNLGEASTLREQFNRDRGMVRLVLLVSPT